MMQKNEAKEGEANEWKWKLKPSQHLIWINGRSSLFSFLSLKAISEHVLNVPLMAFPYLRSYLFQEQYKLFFPALLNFPSKPTMQIVVLVELPCYWNIILHFHWFLCPYSSWYRMMMIRSKNLNADFFLCSCIFLTSTFNGFENLLCFFKTPTKYGYFVQHPSSSSPICPSFSCHENIACWRKKLNFKFKRNKRKVPNSHQQLAG